MEMDLMVRSSRSWNGIILDWLDLQFCQRRAALKKLLGNVMCHLAGTAWAALLFYNKMAADSEGTIPWLYPSLKAWWWNCAKAARFHTCLQIPAMQDLVPYLL